MMMTFKATLRITVPSNTKHYITLQSLLENCMYTSRARYGQLVSYSHWV